MAASIPTTFPFVPRQHVCIHHSRGTRLYNCNIYNTLCELTPSKYNTKYHKTIFSCNARKIENHVLMQCNRVRKHFLVLNSLSLISNSSFSFLAGPVSILFAHIREESGGATRSELPHDF